MGLFQSETSLDNFGLVNSSATGLIPVFSADGKGHGYGSRTKTRSLSPKTASTQLVNQLEVCASPMFPSLASMGHYIHRKPGIQPGRVGFRDVSALLPQNRSSRNGRPKKAPIMPWLMSAFRWMKRSGDLGRPGGGVGDHCGEHLRPNGGRLKPVLQPSNPPIPAGVPPSGGIRSRRLKPVLQPRNPCVPAGIAASEDVHRSGQETRTQRDPIT